MPLTPSDSNAIDRVVGLLAPSKRLLFITGAGLSADSGLPTYRGVGGLYEGRKTPDGLPIERVLSGPMLKSRPDLTWKYLHEIGEASRGAHFNRGHQVIAEMEDHFADVCVLTQNVDGFHRQAGSRNVVDIHGDMRRLVCTKAGCRWEGDAETFEFTESPPKCPRCREAIRPDVVLFGEMLPERHLKTMNRWMDTGFDLVFSVGTSGLFPYIVEPVMLAQEAGVPTVEINPATTEISDLISIKIGAGAAESLDAIWSRYQAQRELN